MSSCQLFRSEVGGGGGIPASHYGPSNTHSAQLGMNLDRQAMGFLCEEGRGP